MTMEIIPISFGKDQNGVEISVNAAGLVFAHCELMETEDPPSFRTRQFFTECLDLYRMFGGTKYRGKKARDLLVVDKFRDLHRAKFGQFFIRRQVRQQAIVELWKRINQPTPGAVDDDCEMVADDQLSPAVDALVILALDHGFYERRLIRQTPDGQWIFTREGSAEMLKICKEVAGRLGSDREFLVIPEDKAKRFGFNEPVSVYLGDE